MVDQNLQALWEEIKWFTVTVWLRQTCSVSVTAGVWTVICELLGNGFVVTFLTTQATNSKPARVPKTLEMTIVQVVRLEPKINQTNCCWLWWAFKVTLRRQIILSLCEYICVSSSCLNLWLATAYYNSPEYWFHNHKI